MKSSVCHISTQRAYSLILPLFPPSQSIQFKLPLGNFVILLTVNKHVLSRLIASLSGYFGLSLQNKLRIPGDRGLVSFSCCGLSIFLHLLFLFYASTLSNIRRWSFFALLPLPGDR